MFIKILSTFLDKIFLYSLFPSFSLLLFTSSQLDLLVDAPSDGPLSLKNKVKDFESFTYTGNQVDKCLRWEFSRLITEPFGSSSQTTHQLHFI